MVITDTEDGDMDLLILRNVLCEAGLFQLRGV